MKASAVEQRAVDWLWHPFIPLGKITMLAGQMGQAKSLFTLWLAAQVTNGTLDRKGTGSVVVLSAEDDADDTTAPRLEAAGADLDRVWIEPVVSLDVNRLRRILDEEMPDTRLLTIDPLQAYLGGADIWKGQQVRAALEPIRLLAQERALAVVIVGHLNRRADVTDPLSRIGDSQGIPQLARSVLLWGPDPVDEDGDNGNLKALTRAKGNLARASAAATFTIEEKRLPSGLVAPVLTRGSNRAINADDVIADNESRTKKRAATDWLRDHLADGQPRSRNEIIEAGIAAGHSEVTLQRSRELAGVVKQQRRQDGKILGWEWLLPLAKEEVI